MTKLSPKAIIIPLLCVLIVFSNSHTANSQAVLTPLRVGERLEFQIKWGFIPAARASMEIAPVESGITGAANHFILRIATYPLIDLLYKFRERVDSYTNRAITRSILYKKVLKGHTKRDIKVIFDWGKHQARYTNFAERPAPITIPDGTLDVLSAFFFIRTQKLVVGQTIERPITDGLKVVAGQLHILKHEKIKIKGRLIDTFKLEPELKDVKGVFEKSKHARMYIWVTADSRKILVRLKSKVIIGSFVATLVNYAQLFPAKI